MNEYEWYRVLRTIYLCQWLESRETLTWNIQNNIILLLFSGVFSAMLHGCSNGVKGVFGEVIRVVQGCYIRMKWRCVTGTLQGCFICVTGVYRCVTDVLQGYYRSVTGVLYGYYMESTVVSQGCMILWLLCILLHTFEYFGMVLLPLQAFASVCKFLNSSITFSYVVTHLHIFHSLLSICLHNLYHIISTYFFYN